MLTYIFIFWLTGVPLPASSVESEIDTVQARHDYHLADSLMESGQYEEAGHFYQQAQRLYRRAHVWDRYVAAGNRLAQAWCRMMLYEQAADAAQRALRAAEQHLPAAHPEVIRSNLYLGRAACYLGRYAEAQAYSQAALRLIEATASRSLRWLASEHELRGLINLRTGQYGPAMNHYQQSLSLRRKEWGDKHKLVAESYDNIGSVYQHQGEYDQAVAYYERAMSVAQESLSGEHPTIAKLYSQTGRALCSKGEVTPALRYCKIALNLYKHSSKDHPEVAWAYNNLGWVYQASRRYKQARQCHWQALLIQRKWYDADHLAMEGSYNNLGALYRDTGVYDSALWYHQRALSTMQKHLGKKHAWVAISLTRIGRVYHQQQSYDSALLAFRQALVANGMSFTDTSRYAHPTGGRYLYGMQLLYTLEARGKTLTALGRHGLALENYLLADSLITQFGQSYARRGDKVSLASTAKRIHERAIETAIQRYETTHDEQYLHTAFRFTEHGKARGLTDALSALEAKQFGAVPDSLLQREASLKEERSFCRSQLTSQDSSLYKKKLFSVDRQYDSLIQVLETKYPSYYQLKYATCTASVPMVQSQLAEDEALISYFVGDSTRHAFVITSEKLRVFSWPADTLLNDQLATLRQALRSNNEDPNVFRKVSYSLYRQLLAPLVETTLFASISQLTIIPDGVLGYLPFELMLTAPSGQSVGYADLPYLIRDYTVRYGYSATWLYYPFSRSDRSTPQQHIAFAPDYSNGVSDRLSSSPAQERYDQLLTPLRFNRQEARNIRQYLPGASYVNQAATEENFKQNAHRYQVIHLAMHAQVNDHDPLYSRLVFSQPAVSSSEDGYLNAYELYDMNISADLAVLSACETGFGKLERGEGVMSLAHAFAYAGCPSIVMSHWLVDDAASARLMDYFYRRLASGQPKDEALRQAKLSYLNTVSVQKAHPFFWSNFVLVGDNLPVRLQPVATTPWSYALGSVLVLLGLLVGAYRYFCRKPGPESVVGTRPSFSV